MSNIMIKQKFNYLFGIFLILFSCKNIQTSDSQLIVQVQDEHFMTDSDIDQLQIINDSLCLVSGFKGDLYLCNYQNGKVIRQYEFNIDDSVLIKKYLEPIAKNIKLLYPSESATIPVISDMPHYKLFGFNFLPEKKLLHIGYYPKIVYKQNQDTVCDYVPFILESDLDLKEVTPIPVFLDYNPETMAEKKYFTNTCNRFISDDDFFCLNNTPHIMDAKTPCFLEFKRIKSDSVSLEKTFGKYPNANSGNFVFKHAFEKNKGQWYYSNEEAVYTFKDSLVFKPQNMEKGMDKIWGFHQLNDKQMLLYVYHADTSENSKNSSARLLTCDLPSGKTVNETILFKAPTFGEVTFFGNKVICLYNLNEKYFFSQYEIK